MARIRCAEASQCARSPLAVEGRSAFVGSDEDRAVAQELGTNRIPPRSFLAHAAAESGEQIADLVARTVGGAIEASLADHSIEWEILNEAGEAMKHLWESTGAPDAIDEAAKPRK
jgi:hypothetical protein